jgi:hypothetical protein
MVVVEERWEGNRWSVVVKTNVPPLLDEVVFKKQGCN